MTVSEIRSLMLEKVIPESLLPQNIAVCLMDENAAPPELDAFTFLNRLRSLGIGSADFLYLLKGCGAPEEAVLKIEQHPDMNLQTLIVTLESSGLTPKDYTPYAIHGASALGAHHNYAYRLRRTGSGG